MLLQKKENTKLNIAVLSGKGGTGKTTLSVNLFNVLNRGVLIDTDTEEPNAHIFFTEQNEMDYSVHKNYPVIDYDKCSFCGLCGEHCNFNAIIPTKKKVIVFDDLCHDCGLCQIVCKNDAISYKSKEIGKITTKVLNNRKLFHTGKLNIGEVSGVRIIDDLKTRISLDNTTIIDCPPGVSCSTVAAIKDVDYAIICAESTPFGISDMKMVVELLEDQNILFGVVVNKSGLGNNDIYKYLQDSNIDVITSIPFDKEIAKLYSNGQMISDHNINFYNEIRKIIDYITGDTND